MTKTCTTHNHLRSQQPSPPQNALSGLPDVSLGTYPPPSPLSPFLPLPPPPWAPASLPAHAQTTRGLQQKQDPMLPSTALSQTGRRLFLHLSPSTSETRVGCLIRLPQGSEDNDVEAPHRSLQSLWDVPSLNLQSEHIRDRSLSERCLPGFLLHPQGRGQLGSVQTPLTQGPEEKDDSPSLSSRPSTQSSFLLSGPVTSLEGRQANLSLEKPVPRSPTSQAKLET